MNQEDRFFPLREKPHIKAAAAAWFHTKWGVHSPLATMWQCMDKELIQ